MCQRDKELPGQEGCSITHSSYPVADLNVLNLSEGKCYTALSLLGAYIVVRHYFSRYILIIMEYPGNCCKELVGYTISELSKDLKY